VENKETKGVTHSFWRTQKSRYIPKRRRAVNTGHPWPTFSHPFDLNLSPLLPFFSFPPLPLPPYIFFLLPLTVSSLSISYFHIISSYAWLKYIKGLSCLHFFLMALNKWVLTVLFFLT
jgi:hypothetical protein